MDNANNQFFLSILIIGLGYASKRFGLTSERDGEGIAKIIFSFTLPALVINTFSKIEVEYSLIWLPIIALVYGLIITVIALFFLKKAERQRKGMLSMVIPGHNIGLFAYPLIEAIWGYNGLKYFGMIDMGNAVILFVVCYMLGNIFSENSQQKSIGAVLRKSFKSIPLIAYILTLTLNLSGISFPRTVLDIAAIVSKANMPLSLLAIGIFLGFKFKKKYLKDMLKVLSIRYITGLVIGITLFLFLPFESMFRHSILIALILPIGFTAIPYSVEFGYNKKFTGTLISITLVISFFLMWLITGIIQ